LRILVVDDDAGSRISVARFLKTMGHQVTQCEKAEEALSFISLTHFPLMLSDIKMPDVSGLDLLREVSFLPLERQPKVVLFTGHGSMESAIEALRMGAYDYLLKPVKAEELVVIIKKIQIDMEKGKMSSTPEKREKDSESNDNRLDHKENIIAFTPKMQQVVVQALKYHTDSSIPILIQGETGTGKELIARLIHNGGKNTDRPFIDINCAAIQANLFESELFGYKGGSFTGGMGKDQKGKFDAAQGGTIFLDEVAEIPIELQAKLLRVVQEREYYRVGGLEKIQVQARIICATNVKLLQAVDEGKFRRDLFYRLQGGQIFLTPLRERREDILPLATRFLGECSRQRKKAFKGISVEAGKTLLNHNWLGNVRELRNVIEWAVFMYDEEELKPYHLENSHFITEKVIGTVESLAKYLEKDQQHIDRLVYDALQKYNGNKTAAARYLGISRRSLYRLLEKSNI